MKGYFFIIFGSINESLAYTKIQESRTNHLISCFSHYIKIDLKRQTHTFFRILTLISSIQRNSFLNLCDAVDQIDRRFF